MFRQITLKQPIKLRHRAGLAVFEGSDLQSLPEGTRLDLRFSLFSRGQEDFSLGLDHWMAQVRIFRGDVRHLNIINS